MSGCASLPEVLWSLTTGAMSFTHTISRHCLGHGRHSLKYFLIVVLLLLFKLLLPKSLLLKLVSDEVPI